MIAALLALALAGPPTSPPPAPAAPPIEVVEAGQIEYDPSLDRTVVTGGVVLRRGQVTLRADSAVYDERTGEVDAKGGVLLLEPGRAAFGESLHAVLDGPYAARDVVAFLKDAPLDLSRCRTLDEARGSGRNRVSLGGRTVTGESSEPGFQIERARITLCDCGAGPPSWQLRARSASVVPGDHAWLTLPVLYITPRFLFLDKPIPVMAFPVLYLPLGERKSGLLMPGIDPMSPNGVILSQPFFLALGRSYDATVTLNYTFGPSGRDVQGGVKGLGGDLELRWAPAEGAGGGARFFFTHSDYPTWAPGVYRPPGTNRMALSAVHEQAFSDRTHLKLEVAVLGDPLYLNNFTGDPLLRGTQYRRSAVALTHRTDDLALEADASYHLPLVNLGSGDPSRPAPFGLFGTSLKTFHRLPSASVSLLPLRLAGPLHLSASAGVARFAPLAGPTGDEGDDGIGPGENGWGTGTHPAFDLHEDDGRWQGNERLAATRAVVRAELRAPMSVGRALAVEPWVNGTAAGYAYDAGPSPQLDARFAGGLTLSTDLSRAFGQVRHRIEPRLAFVAGTGQLGRSLPNYAYDELDVAAPLAAPAAGTTVPVRRTLTAAPGSFQQMQLSVRNRLTAPALSAELSLGQDVDLGAGRLSETWAQGRFMRGLSFGSVSADATARFLAFGAKRAEGSGPASVSLPASRFFDAFTSLLLNLTLADKRGDNVHARLFAVGKGGSPRLMAGLEPLFDPRPLAVDALANGAAGLVAKLSGATLTYDALFYARSQASPACPKASTSPHVYAHVLSVVWDSPCHCWRAGLNLTVNECDATPRLGFVFDLSSVSERKMAF